MPRLSTMPVSNSGVNASRRTGWRTRECLAKSGPLMKSINARANASRVVGTGGRRRLQTCAWSLRRTAAPVGAHIPNSITLASVDRQSDSGSGPPQTRSARAV